MANFRIKFDKKNLEKALARSPKILGNEISKGMLRAGIVFGERFKRNRLNNATVMSDGLSKRTGFLRQSIKSEVIGKGLKIRNIVSIGGPTAPYARIHEKGGTIHAKSGGPLLTFAPSGSPLTKRSARTTKRPRNVPNLQFIPTKRGGIWVKKLKGGARGPIYFVSVKSVKIRARLKWIKTFKSVDTQKIYETQVNRAITKAIRLAGLAG